MKITENNYGHIKEHTLEGYITGELDGADYERGALEEAAATADNTARALARLIELLVEDDKLKLNDVYYVLKGYRADCLKKA